LSSAALRRRMAAHGEAVLRQRVCLLRDCLATFFLCSHCDRGQRYCSVACRDQARRRQRRAANRRHQRSPEGRLDHRDRQRQYRHRRAQARVTDQGSLSITCSAISACGPGEPAATQIAQVYVARRRPLWPQSEPGVQLRCRICGRIGRFIDPFPPIPRRR
jgi:hypothetical protein